MNFGSMEKVSKEYDTTECKVTMDQSLAFLNFTHLNKYDEFYGNYQDIVVQDNLAYVKTDCGELLIFNISGYQFELIGVYTTVLFNPEEVKIQTSRYHALFVSKGLAFMALDKLGIIVVNVTNPYLPEFLAFYEEIHASELYVEDDVLYLIGPIFVIPHVIRATPFEIYNISSIFEPQFISNYTIPENYLYEMIIKDGYAYFGCSYGMVILDVRDISAPNEVLNVNFDTKCSIALMDDMLVAEVNYVYQNNQFSFYNISNPSNPIFSGYYNFTEAAVNIHINNRIAYVGNNTHLLAINLSDINNCTIIGIYSMKSNLIKYNSIIHFLSYESSTKKHIILIKSEYISGLYMYSLTPFSNAEMLSCYDLTNNPLAVYAAADKLFFKSSDAFVIVSINSEAEPLLLSVYECSDKIEAFEVSGDYAFLGLQYNGLAIVDISDPSNPNLVFSNDSLWSYQIALDEENHLLYAGEYDKITVIDIANPEEPVVKFNYKLDYWVSDMQIYEEYLMVSSSYPYGYVFFYDMSNPTYPVLKSNVSGFDYASSIYFESNYMYMIYSIDMFLKNSIRYSIYDISNIIDIKSIYTTSQYQQAEKIFVKNEVAYIIFNSIDQSYYYLNHLLIQDVKNKSNPVNITTYYGSSSASIINDVYINNSYLFISEYNEGILIFNFSYIPPPPPTSPPPSTTVKISLMESMIGTIVFTFANLSIAFIIRQRRKLK